MLANGVDCLFLSGIEKMKNSNTQLHGIALLRLLPTWRMAAHYHPYHELIVILQGRMKVHINAKTLEANTGDILFYQAGMPHEEASHSQTSLETFCMSFESRRSLSLLPVQIPDNSGRIRQLTSWIHEERHANSTSALHSREMFLEALIAELERLHSPQPSSLITMTRSHIYHHLSEIINLDDLAANVGLSKFSFLRKYKQIAGVTPMEDLRNIRIQYARDLILTSTLPLKEIAPRSGLGDEYHLAKVFRKYLNTAPSELRKKVRE